MILKIILLSLYYFLQLYIGIIILYFILSWFSGIRYTKFYSIIDKIAYPFMKIFSGRIVIGNFDLSGTLGLIILEYLLSWFYKLIYLF